MLVAVDRTQGLGRHFFAFSCGANYLTEVNERRSALKPPTRVSAAGPRP